MLTLSHLNRPAHSSDALKRRDSRSHGDSGSSLPVDARGYPLDAGCVLPIRADAARAGLNPLRLALDQHHGLLDVRPKHPVRLPVRVTDVVAERHRLVTNITSATHGLAF